MGYLHILFSRKHFRPQLLVALLVIAILYPSAGSSLNIRPVYIEICNKGRMGFAVARLHKPDYANPYGSYTIGGWWWVKPRGSCIDVDDNGSPGRYRFAFMVKRENGWGIVKPTVGRWGAWDNSDRKFCVLPYLGEMKGRNDLSFFADLSNCPDDWVMAPWPVYLRPMNGSSNTLNANLDNMEVVVSQASSTPQKRENPVQPELATAEKMLNEVVENLHEDGSFRNIKISDTGYLNFEFKIAYADFFLAALVPLGKTEVEVSTSTDYKKGAPGLEFSCSGGTKCISWRLLTEGLTFEKDRGKWMAERLSSPDERKSIVLPTRESASKATEETARLLRSISAYYAK